MLSVWLAAVVIITPLPPDAPLAVAEVLWPALQRAQVPGWTLTEGNAGGARSR